MVLSVLVSLINNMSNNLQLRIFFNFIRFVAQTIDVNVGQFKVVFIVAVYIWFTPFDGVFPGFSASIRLISVLIFAPRVNQTIDKGAVNKDKISKKHVLQVQSNNRIIWDRSRSLLQSNYSDFLSQEDRVSHENSLISVSGVHQNKIE